MGIMKQDFANFIDKKPESIYERRGVQASGDTHVPPRTPPGSMLTRRREVKIPRSPRQSSTLNPGVRGECVARPFVQSALTRARSHIKSVAQLCASAVTRLGFTII